MHCDVYVSYVDDKLHLYASQSVSEEACSIYKTQVTNTLKNDALANSWNTLSSMAG